MATKGDADYFLFIERGLRTLEPAFYLLSSAQAKAAHKDYSGSGNCLPNRVRATVDVNDFSILTGEPPEPIFAPEPRPVISQPKPKYETSDLRRTIAQKAEFNGSRPRANCHITPPFRDFP
ncbi:hypothetical protein EBB79_03005 [Parasedimentitalea marina]|uniref:Uncharacterized protein n=1 Tax=Parasedimentitalea marina TaxID=2483033 RepID=A0A3T0MYX6_9RHOB|nr:hypothetical protein EBB79_03005 [Parasedimentitalea marina]